MRFSLDNFWQFWHHHLSICISAHMLCNTHFCLFLYHIRWKIFLYYTFCVAMKYSTYTTIALCLNCTHIFSSFFFGSHCDCFQAHLIYKSMCSVPPFSDLWLHLWRHKEKYISSDLIVAGVEEHMWKRYVQLQECIYVGSHDAYGS